MSDRASDPVVQAAIRLEAAVESLATALSMALMRPPGSGAGDPAGEDSVPRAEVAALAERLDATLGKLRAALQEELRAEAGGPEEEE
jgi:hypothetical protein